MNTSERQGPGLAEQKTRRAQGIVVKTEVVAPVLSRTRAASRQIFDFPERDRHDKAVSLAFLLPRTRLAQNQRDDTSAQQRLGRAEFFALPVLGAAARCRTLVFTDVHCRSLLFALTLEFTYRHTQQNQNGIPEGRCDGSR